MRTSLLFLLAAGCSVEWKLIDGDGDGYGVSDGDCNDFDASVNPDAVETWYDGVDQNCDGRDDFDADGDGFSIDDECDDTDPNIYPSDAPEVWYDCVDDNCDGNDGDQDGDGFVPDDYVASCPEWQQLNPTAQAGDCWDTPDEVPSGFEAINDLPQPEAVDVYPGADDTPYDGVDAACDGDALEFDVDGDGHNSSAWVDREGERGDDCDDANEAVNPGATETCLTVGVDDDCDGSTIGVDAEECQDFFVDSDGDTYGGQEGQCRCEAGGGYTADNSDDCDDSDAAIKPGASEVCDGLDNDCDGDVDADDADATDLETFYVDADGDGYGDSDTTGLACPGDSGWSSEGGDCHDDQATAYPGSHETETPLDGIDTDCDGEDVCTDLNCDGWPDLLYTSFDNGSNYLTQAQIFYNTGSSPAFANGGTDEDFVDGYGISDAAVADLDGDGYLDVVLADYRDDVGGNAFEVDSFVYWGLASGYGGTTGSGNRLALPTQGASDVLIEDIDGDGALDVVFAGHIKNGNNYAASSYIYWGSSLSGRSASDVTSVITPGALAVASGDLDGDGYTDLVFADSYSNSDQYETDSYIYWGGEDATDYFDGSGRTAIPTQGANDVLVEDIDNDGFLDVVIANRQKGNNDYGTAAGDVDVEICWGDGTRNTFNPDHPDYTAPTELYTRGARELAVADLDGDGLLDVLVTQYEDANGPYTSSKIFVQTSARSFTATSLSVVGARRPAVADLDDDGALDIIWPPELEAASTPYDRAWVFEGDPSNLGVYSSSVRQGLTDVHGASGVAVGDVDGDGVLDLCFSEAYDASFNEASTSTIYLGQANGTFLTSFTVDLSTVNPTVAPLLVGPGL